MVKFGWSSVDKGWNRLVAAQKLIAQRKAYVKAGLLGGDKDYRPGEAITNVQLGLVHEFGTDHVPERSWIRSTFEEKRAEYVELLKKLLVPVYEGKWGITRALGIVGARMASDQKKAVKTGAGIPPPNAPSTIEAKGSSRPLVDTSAMINSVTWEVVGGD